MVGIKLVRRLQLSFSHLLDMNICLDMVLGTLNPLFYCSIKAETTIQYFLHCYFFDANRSDLMNDFNEIGSFFLHWMKTRFDLILHGIGKLDDKKNCNILMSTIKFINDLMNTCWNYLSINVKQTYALYMCIFLELPYFLLMFLVFAILRFYIYPVQYSCMFFRFSVFENGTAELVLHLV